MKKINPKLSSVTCIIVIFTIFCMSMVVMPITANESKDILDEFEHELTNETTEEFRPEISIQGSAQLQCSPDIVGINLRIRTIDLQSAVTAKNDAAVIIDEVIKQLKLLGISEDCIETTSYNINMKYEWEKDSRVFKGYEVVVNMKVSLKDFDLAGKVIDKSVDAGAFINSVTFELSSEKRQELKTTVFAQAAIDAKTKASAIAEALDYTLGDVKSVNVNNYDYQPRTYWKNSYDGAAESVAPPTTILPGDLTLSGNVNIVFDMYKE